MTLQLTEHSIEAEPILSVGKLWMRVHQLLLEDKLETRVRWSPVK